MTTARVPKLPLDEAKAAADEAAVPDYMAELSIFQVLLNHPQLARAINDLLATMLWHGALDPRVRELVIMRIGWLTACDYEWTQHWRVASRLGVTAEDLLAVRDWCIAPRACRNSSQPSWEDFFRPDLLTKCYRAVTSGRY